MVEPLSVQIARKRGCDPLCVPVVDLSRERASWRCACKGDVGHTGSRWWGILWEEGVPGVRPAYESWAHGLAAWDLLTELVDAGRKGDQRAGTLLDAALRGGPGMSDISTLGTGIMLAWLEWRDGWPPMN